MLSPKAIIMLSQHSFENVFDAKLDTWFQCDTPSIHPSIHPMQRWRWTRSCVYCNRISYIGCESAIFIAQNPLAINMRLRLPYTNSFPTNKPTYEMQIVNKNNRNNVLEWEKERNYLCKQQTYQQIWIMQKLNLVRSYN